MTQCRRGQILLSVAPTGLAFFFSLPRGSLRSVMAEAMTYHVRPGLPYAAPMALVRRPAIVMVRFMNDPSELVP